MCDLGKEKENALHEREDGHANTYHHHHDDKEKNREKIVVCFVHTV